MKKQGYLVLENGQIFKGELFAKSNKTIGEIVFTTGMGNYLQTITDKNFYGQIVLQSFPSIGNYGVIAKDFESNGITIAGYVIKELCVNPSNFRSQKGLDTFFLENKTPVIGDLDTRAIVRTLRQKGTMNALITDDIKNINFDKIKNFKLINPVKEISTKKIYELNSKAKTNIVVWDFGINQSILDELVNNNYKVTVVPCNYSCKQIMNLKPKAIILSNGPGDPRENIEIIDQIKLLMKQEIPILAIGLGHQMLALANSFKVTKLIHGHRGCNQPVKDLLTGLVNITNQNHGFIVDTQSIDQKIAKEFLINVNDRSNEGIIYTNCKNVSIQFAPDSCTNSKNTSYLYKDFFKKIGEK